MLLLPVKSPLIVEISRMVPNNQEIRVRLM